MKAKRKELSSSDVSALDVFHLLASLAAAVVQNAERTKGHVAEQYEVIYIKALCR